MFTVWTDFYSAWCSHPQAQGPGRQPGSGAAGSGMLGGLSGAACLPPKVLCHLGKRSFHSWEHFESTLLIATSASGVPDSKPKIVLLYTLLPSPPSF
jgi:hypothetical protein